MNSAELALEVLKLCPETRTHSMMAALTMKHSVLTQIPESSVLTSSNVLQALEKLFSEPEVQNADAIVLVETHPVRGYYPDPRSLDDFVKALNDKGIHVFSYRTAGKSWLRSIHGIIHVNDVSKVVSKAPESISESGGTDYTGIITGVFCSAGLTLLTAGLILFSVKHRSRRTDGLIEPIQNISIEMKNRKKNKDLIESQAIDESESCTLLSKQYDSLTSFLLAVNEEIDRYKDDERMGVITSVGAVSSCDKTEHNLSGLEGFVKELTHFISDVSLSTSQLNLNLLPGLCLNAEGFLQLPENTSRISLKEAKLALELALRKYLPEQ